MRTIFALLLLLSIAMAGAARADIVEPPWTGDCTLERARSAGGSGCIECRSDAARAYECAERHGDTLVQSCTRYDGGEFVQIWCENEVDPSAGVPSPERATHIERRIDIVRMGAYAAGGCGVLAIAAIGIALGLIARRKRKP